MLLVYFCLAQIIEFISLFQMQSQGQTPFNGPRTAYDTVMLQFEQLINNRVFLLCFIDCLEAQKSFHIRDKYAALNPCSNRLCNPT